MADYPYLIIGAGPAGVQLSYFLAKAGLKHRVLEKAEAAGTFFRDFPRHGKLLSINKVYTGTDDPEINMRWDWNSLLSEDGPLFKDVSKRYFADAIDVVTYMKKFVDHHQTPIDFGFDVQRIERDGSDFVVKATDGRIVSCERLIIATGMYKPWEPDIPGIELCESYADVSVDPQDFVNQRVLILGKGNSAFETADNLVETAASIHVSSPQPLKMAWRTHFVGHLRAVNNNLLDTYQLKSQNAVLDADIKKIERHGDGLAVTVAYAHADGEVETLYYDRAITCTGFQFDRAIFADNCMPELRSCGRLPLMTSQWESTNIPGLFYAGTLMQSRDYKKYMSSFIHGFRYNVLALARMLEQRFHGTPWPSRAVGRSATELNEALFARMNKSSALWQQPGFLVDVVRVDATGASSEYYEELPFDYAKDSVMHKGLWLVLSLEFGKEKALDPFHVQRVHRSDIDRAALSLFLHPIVRVFEDGVQVAEQHVLEDLAAEWREEEHTAPMHAFLERVLAGTAWTRDIIPPKHSGVVGPAGQREPATGTEG